MDTLLLTAGALWLIYLVANWRQWRVNISYTLLAIGLSLLIGALIADEEAQYRQQQLDKDEPSLQAPDNPVMIANMARSSLFVAIAGAIMMGMGAYGLASGSVRTNRLPLPTDPRQIALRQLEQRYETGQIDRATFEQEVKKLFTP